MEFRGERTLERKKRRYKKKKKKLTEKGKRGKTENIVGKGSVHIKTEMCPILYLHQAFRLCV